jgi:hypothetical protein
MKMGIVKAFKLPGIDMWFPSGDHQPPHFHARRPGHWEARVYFLNSEDAMIEIVRPIDASIHGKDRKMLHDAVTRDKNRDLLLKEWEAFQPQG